MADAKFYKCKKCANLFLKVQEGPCTPVCCGEPFDELIAGTVDAAREKHIPMVTREGGRIIVNVGEVDHPMLDAHFIQWVALVADGRTEIHYLKPGEAPHTEFSCEGSENVSIYEYCNLHGLWKADI